MIKSSTLKLAIILCAIIASPMAISNDDLKNVFGFNYGFYSPEYYDISFKNVDYETGHVLTSTDIYYRRMLNQYIGIEAGGMVGGGDFITDWLYKLDMTGFQYSGMRMAFYGRLPIAFGVSVYTKLGGATARVRYKLYGMRIIERESGLYGAAGVEFRFDSAWGINAEFQKMDLSALNTDAFYIGGSYMF